MGRLPRYGYLDTPKGTWREDRKTGKFVWRKLGSDFPYRSIIYANPTTPCDIFLENSYFKGLDERGQGTILIGVKL